MEQRLGPDRGGPGLDRGRAAAAGVQQAVIDEGGWEMSKLNWWQRGLVGLLVLLALVLINWWVFREWLELDYFQWYLDKGR